MKTVDRVLEVLYDRREGYLGLDELASAAGLTRPQAERAVRMLQQRGHRLENVPVQGLRLARPVRLDGHLIGRDLGTRRIGRHVVCFEAVDSTNDVAFRCVGQKGADGLVILAECQRQGRGRHGRRWVSPPGANILLSVLLVDPAGPPAHEAMTIAAGLAVAEAIESCCGLACGLKWPNDVLLDGRKVAGVLVETRRHQGRGASVVGIGINVNAAPAPGEVRTPAACLADATGQPVERIELVRGVLRRLDAWDAQVREGRLENLHAAWVSRCAMRNERIAVRCGGRRYEGRVLDVSPLEGLILCDDDGRRVHLPARSSTIVS